MTLSVCPRSLHCQTHWTHAQPHRPTADLGSLSHSHPGTPRGCVPAVSEKSELFRSNARILPSQFGAAGGGCFSCSVVGFGVDVCSFKSTVQVSVTSWLYLHCFCTLFRHTTYSERACTTPAEQAPRQLTACERSAERGGGRLGWPRPGSCAFTASSSN